MNINQVLHKIPKPALVIGILILSIILFVYNDPLRDECEVQTKIFQKNTSGLLSAVKKNKKIQFAQINYMKDRCREGNSLGACSDYFDALKVVANELRTFNEKCQVKYSEENETFALQISQALQVMSLVAWGDKPPTSIAERIGWLNESHIRTFCALKKAFLNISDEENLLAIRDRIFLDYPDAWPEALLKSDSSKKYDLMTAENRPKALKTALNPTGTLTKNQVYEKSLFSLRCDLYL